MATVLKVAQTSLVKDALSYSPNCFRDALDEAVLADVKPPVKFFAKYAERHCKEAVVTTCKECTHSYDVCMENLGAADSWVVPKAMIEEWMRGMSYVSGAAEVGFSFVQKNFHATTEDAHAISVLNESQRACMIDGLREFLSVDLNVEVAHQDDLADHFADEAADQARNLQTVIDSHKQAYIESLGKGLAKIVLGSEDTEQGTGMIKKDFVAVADHENTELQTLAEAVEQADEKTQPALEVVHCHGDG